MNLDEMLSIARQQGFTDVHVSPDFPLIGRKNGKLTVLEANPVSADHIRRIMESVMPEQEKLTFLKGEPAVFMYAAPDQKRYRVSAYSTDGKPALSFRIVNDKINNPIRLSLPKDVSDLAASLPGIVLIASPASEGKTTVLAAMTEWLNQNKNAHVLTVSYPLEHVFSSRRSLIHGICAKGNEALKVLENAVYMDADVIAADLPLDSAVFDELVKLASEGKRVFVTVPAKDSYDAIDKIMSLYPVNDQDRALKSLLENLRGIYAQRKVYSPSADKVSVAYEAVYPDEDVVNAVLAVNPAQYYETVRRKENMRTMDESFANLVRALALTKEEALGYVKDEKIFSKYLIEGR